ncbi:MAG: hypothetical protein HRU13_06240, partial [Phycisphaerales bacterium]|nr:hypothetical protein [Phycisphaerales bacterium]
HITPFTDHQAEIGLSAETVALLTSQSGSARDAWDSYVAARQAATAAKTAWYEAIGEATTTARSALRNINTFAKDQQNPDGVYALAEIDPPKPREPLGEPPVPTDLTVTLDTEGRANLRFKGTRQGGTVFTIQRRTTGTDGLTTSWTTITTIAERVFIDGGTPTGVASIAYRVRGERVGGTSAFSSPITLFLGTSGNQDEGQAIQSEAA